MEPTSISWHRMPMTMIPYWANIKTVSTWQRHRYLNPENGPSLTCLPNGQVTHGFAHQTPFKLDELAITQLLSHPVIIPHGYDSSSYPELEDHTIFGPRQFVPEDSLADLEEAGFAVFLAVSEDDVQETEITLSVDWVTYHELIGVVTLTTSP